MPERVEPLERVQPSLRDLRPKFLGDLVRVGAAGDGGYVVNERAILQSQFLMSFGVNDDWSFELAFLDRKPDAQVFCYDHSVSKEFFREQMLGALNDVLSLRFALLALRFKVEGARRTLSALKHRKKIYRSFSSFVARENVRFYERGISNEKTASFVTFAEAFQSMASAEIPENSVFVKMDIEQFEFRVLPDLLKFDRYISGLVVEFHDLDLLWDRFVELTERLKAHFEITHVHGNNYAGLIPNSGIPKVLEITFLKKSLIREERSGSEAVTYPIPQLDYPNKRSERDYPLGF